MPLWWFCCCHWCNFQNTVLWRLLFILSADTRLCQHPDWAISSTDSPTIKKYYKHKKLIKLTLCQALDVVFMAWRSFLCQTLPPFKFTSLPWSSKMHNKKIWYKGKKKCGPRERGEGGGDEGLILLVLRRDKRNLAKEMAKATPNFNKRGFISLCSFIIIIQKPLSVAKFMNPHTNT